MNFGERFWAAVCLHPTWLSDEEYDRAFEHPASAEYPSMIVRCLRPVDHDGRHLTTASNGEPALWLNWDRTEREFWVGDYCPVHAGAGDEPTYEQHCWLPLGHIDPHDFDYRPDLRWPFPDEQVLHPRAQVDLDASREPRTISS